MADKPRIIRVMYRSATNGKMVRLFMKVPYSHAFDLAEVLTRQLMTGQIAWFRIDPAKPSEITPKIRESLQRWPEVLRDSSSKTEVDWAA